MKKKFIFIVALLSLAFTSRIRAEEIVSYSPHFQLVMEDGSIEFSCISKPRPGGGPDWEVRCGEKSFSVHLAVIKSTTGDKLVKYQILYWVLDYNDRPDSTLAGTHHGTNLDVIFQKNQPTQTLKIGQVVGTIWNLNVQLRL